MSIIFADDQEETPQVDQTKDYLTELVGDGKKFKTAADLAKGKAESDLFIQQLQREAALLRQELNGKIKLEEFIDKMNTIKPVTPETTIVTTTEGKPATDTSSQNSLTMEAVEKLFSEREKKTLEDANLRLVASTLEQTFGPDFQKIVSEKAKELELGKDYLLGIAKTHPSSFLKIMGGAGEVKKTENKTFSLPASSVSSQSFKPNSGPPQKFSDFEKLRKSDFRAYMKPAVQNEMMRLTREFGDDFLKF